MEMFRAFFVKAPQADSGPKKMKVVETFCFSNSSMSTIIRCPAILRKVFPQNISFSTFFKRTGHLEKLPCTKRYTETKDSILGLW